LKSSHRVSATCGSIPGQAEFGGDAAQMLDRSGSPVDA